MRIDEIYNRFVSFSNFKEHYEKSNKTSFGVLTTIELNLRVELTISYK